MVILQGWVAPQETEVFVNQMGLQLERRVTDRLGAERWSCVGKGHQLCPTPKVSSHGDLSALLPRSPDLSHWPLLRASALKASKPSVGFDPYPRLSAA